jgi:preprotein translocase subunit SecG
MQVVTTIIIVIHVLVSLGLVALILLHAGRGGGMSDMFGGGMGPQQFQASTVVERNLDRMTVIVSGVFGLTTIALAVLLG